MMAGKAAIGVVVALGMFALLVGALGLIAAYRALGHHELLWTGGNWAGRTWMTPWQAIVGYSLFVLFGSFLIIRAVRSRFK